MTAELTTPADLVEDLPASGIGDGLQEQTPWTWVVVGPQIPSPAEAQQWVVRATTGAVVTFAGTVRDHAPGYEQVHGITYEVYGTEAVRRLTEVVGIARATWSDAGRIALFHRSGYVALGEESVLVVVASPHRRTAFDVARFCIDVLKVSVPVWKLEHDGVASGWSETGVMARSVREAADAWLAEEATEGVDR
ncbi:molybdopterin synthase catalytic subunit [Nocardioides bruguierae]|uniref:Molybdenum cofactor biosynthesis protein MoaE n=1 Tax=Nocardioides bruguierae TaxID=2945102 RepID=A0A9X2IIF0_9ACTN|nr:molybdenum cofactor biosynthesis protein MoaE [Nocardioides bruguierae]MCM0622750.1 molybdenum cofactor biosynthesis protein MoaE [Nocardioides bruguierae]